jgi:hypothetical protein
VDQRKRTKEKIAGAHLCYFDPESADNNMLDQDLQTILLPDLQTAEQQNSKICSQYNNIKLSFYAAGTFLFIP